MRGRRRILVVVWSVIASAAVLPVGSPQAKDSVCSHVLRGASVRGPAHAVAWRAEIEGRTAVFGRLPTKSLRPARWLAPTDAPWLLVLSHPHAAHGRCWPERLFAP